VTCPDEQQFVDLLDERLDDAARAALHSHASGCDACRRLLATLARTRSDAPAGTVAHYRLEQVIGRGGMGVVYRATDTRLRRPVALKVLSPHLVGDARAAARLVREARAAGALDHPNVAQVYDVGQEGDVVYLALAFYDGETLRDRLRRGPLAPRDAAALLLEIARGLGAAHATGVVHRDVKPSNVLLTPTGARLLDFGLAKLVGASVELTDSGQLLGTVAYMAPEQQGGAADPRVDVWSLGVTAYEMLAGAPPFAGETAMSILHAAQTLDPSPPPAPPSLQAIVLRCLEKQPARRYANGAEVAAELERFLRGDAVEARRPGVVTRGLRRVARRRLAIAAVIGLVVAVISVGALVRARLHARARVERAERLAQAAQRMRSTLTNAYLLPLHDTSPERRTVRAELKAIEDELRRLGPDERGLAEYALGIGHLALREYVEARPHLEAAWRAGQNGPEAAYALAIDLVTLYGEQRALNERLPSSERAAADAKLAAEIRDPALGYVRASQSAGPPGAVEALLAYYENRRDDAIRLTGEVFDRSPSHYELGNLHATLLIERAVHAWERGDKDALAAFDAAEATLRRVLSVARSDPRVYVEAAHRTSRMAFYRAFAGTAADSVAAFERAVALGEQAIQAMPDAADSYNMLADSLIGLAQAEESSGHDGRAPLRRAVAVAERALSVNPTHWRAKLYHGMALTQLGVAEIAQGNDGRALIQRGIGSLEASLAQRDWEDTYHELAIAHWTLAEELARRGQDPRAAFERAIAVLKKTLATDESERNSNIYIDLGGVLVARARWSLEQGVDPLADLDAAIAALEKAARLSVNDPLSHTALSEAYVVRARFELGAGTDANAVTASIDRAVAEAERSRALDDTDALAPANLAVALRLRAIVELAAGREPSSTLRRARELIHLARQRKASDAAIARAEVRIELTAAAAARRRDARPSLERARATLAFLRSRDPDDAEALALAGEAARLAGGPAACTDGDAALTRAISVNPKSARALWARAALDESCGRAQRAQASRAEATRIEPWIARDPG
jgi:serine/threonine-protein kinase